MKHVLYSTLSDMEIFHLMKRDDHHAYNEIYRRYFHIIFRHAYRKLRNEDSAKDVIQDVFTNLWLKRGSNEIDTNLAGYLFKAVRNRVFDRFAHEQVMGKYWESIEHSFQTEKYAGIPADHLIREHQLAAYIEQQIGELPTKMRRIFEMSRKEHLSHREIAERLQTTEGNVAKQMTNALRVLRAKLGVIIYLLFLVLGWIILIIASYFKVSFLGFIHSIFNF